LTNTFALAFDRIYSVNVTTFVLGFTRRYGAGDALQDALTPQLQKKDGEVLVYRIISYISTCLSKYGNT